MAPSTRQRSAVVGLLVGAGVSIAVLVGLVVSGGDGDGLDARLDEPGAYQEPAGGLAADAPDGEPLPDLELTTFDGAPFRFDDLQGAPAVINFWASYCAPCVKEMPAIESVHQELGDQVAIVGINNQDRDDKANELATKTGVTYPLVRDPRGDAFFELGLSVMPTTLFVDAGGNVVATEFGELTGSELSDKIHRLLLSP